MRKKSAMVCLADSGRTAEDGRFDASASDLSAVLAFGFCYRFLPYFTMNLTMNLSTFYDFKGPACGLVQNTVSPQSYRDGAVQT